MSDHPIWTPAYPEKTNMMSFFDYVSQKYKLQLNHYSDLHQWSINKPAQFWQEIVSFFSIQFDKTASETYVPNDCFYQSCWFKDAELNYAKNLLSRRDDAIALISVKESGESLSLSFATLYDSVAQAVQGLKTLGVQSGDRVVGLMPNCAETIIAMLACSSIGAIWSSCSPDFGAQAVIDRFHQVEPKVLICCNGYTYNGKQHLCIEKSQAIVDAISTIEHCVMLPFIEQEIDRDCIKWSDFLQPATQIDFVPLPFNHPLFIMFSSGTTGVPKCIVHGAGGTLLQHVKELGLHTDLRQDERLCFYTTCGWMMWNWMTTALALGTTLVLYDGSPAYPNPQRLFELAEDYELDVLGTSPKYLSSLMHAGIHPAELYSLHRLRCILSTGSPLVPILYDYVYEHIKTDVQLSSISGGTDIISCFALGNPVLPVYRGEIQCVGLGMDVEVIDPDGKAINQQRGELACLQPFPSMPVYFWQDPENKRYQKSYFSRFKHIWTHGDFAEMTQHGGLVIYGRSDAVLNPGGVRIGTAEIYRQVEKIPEVVDSVVVSQRIDDDVRVVLFVQMQEGITLDAQYIKRIQRLIKENTSPRHVPAKILQVSGIPRTINGKVMELAVRQLVDGEKIDNLNAIANPDVLKEFINRAELEC